LNDLEAKKKALAAEAEVYRQTLKLELQNLRLYGMKAKRAASSLSFSNPMLVLAAALAGTLLKRRKSFRLRAASIAFLGWQIYQKLFLPMRSLLWRRGSRRSRRTSRDYDRVAAQRF
jgi:hypothetical protein